MARGAATARGVLPELPGRSKLSEATPPATLGRSGVTLERPLGIGTMQWGRTWLDGKLNRGGNLSEEACREVRRFY